jgi:hypothetical protein
MANGLSLRQGLVGPIGSRRSAEMLVTTRKKSWRLDGHKLDRQRDWLGVSGRRIGPFQAGFEPFTLDVR